MTLLADVVEVLRRESVPHAIIGAGALAAHGVARATADIDLLVTETRCLTLALWAPLADRSDVDIRVGDDTDPLAGVVRIRRLGDLDVDIVVGRHSWQAECLRQATGMAVGGVPVVSLAGLVLLKVYAGGPQDAWDIHQLLDLVPDPDLIQAVEGALPSLPADAARLWRTILRERREAGAT